jgi:hypothetical protein
LGSNGCAKRTQEYMLVRVEYPYVQLRAVARVTCTEFVVRVINGRERDELPSLYRVEVESVFFQFVDCDRLVPSFSLERYWTFPFITSREGPVVH